MSVSLRTIKAFVIDMDGVLYRGQARLPGARAFLLALQREDVPYVLLTNNSTLTVAQYVEKLRRMDIEVAPERILTSAVATALYLAGRAEPGTPMYMIGMDGLEEALREQGFVLTDGNPEYVVVGLDTDATYQALSTATLAIRDGAAFIGTNPDPTLPTERGLEPGAGAILAAIEAATGVQPQIIGKPQPGAFEVALRRLNTRPGETAMLGDRMETDVVGGARAGLRTILVLTGATSRDDLANAEVEPDWVFDRLEQVLAARR
ncbi:MAG: HAD-IIA family hydrolase [Anaerolineae bacterium]